MIRLPTSVALIIALLTISASAALVEDILVFAAASLTNAMQQLGPRFTTRTGKQLSLRLDLRDACPTDRCRGHLPMCSFPPMNSK
jgi:hypothetical protein